MNYANFDSQITDKLGIVCVGWLLPKFVSPSDVGSKLELEILHNAWKNGAARFERLAIAELNARKRQSQAMSIDAVASSTPQDASPVRIPITPSALDSAGGSLSRPLQPSPPPPPSMPPHHAAPSSVTGIILANGETVIARKLRKKRSDAGKPRGPRKKANTAQSTPTVSETTTVPSTSSASSALSTGFRPSLQEVCWWEPSTIRLVRDW